ncbi:MULTISPECIES: sigma 54-interacting transcriptional regulator [Lysinibacillus]|uniref:PAS domain S-box protein n=1 Tax=Lysinibacillus antri TaxID=2498145 RepID=A0A432L6T4_9BACI|nr:MULTISPECIES: sigma 54-interacting transcriptional regulator [Lysinibacillus]RUL46447.1 PAS domain S-box protein [Lysinibacillus antri]TSI03886.1 PAS domain S-box protein [Lysinibacillus sp. BW-2-10]
MFSNINHLTKFYEYAVDYVSVGIHAVDRNGHTVLYNNKMKEIEGYNIEDISERSILDIFMFQQNDSTLLRVLQTGVKEMNVKQTYWNKNGHEITTINDTFPILHNGEIIGAIEFARDITSLEKLVYQPLRRYGEPLTFDVITSVSEQMNQVIETAKKAAHARIPVLLIGESGTGKDLVAESIHYELNPINDEFVTLFSRRTNQSIIDKIQSYLTYEKSFTFFFERIELLSLPMQNQLLETLNTLSTGKHMIIGSIGDDPIDLISNGQLLKDLYYYFASMTISIPPLKARKEDIKPFVQDYFSRHRERFNSNIQGASDDVLEQFLQYEWPGNLKELELLLDEIASMITNEQLVTSEMLPLHFRFKIQQLDQTTRKPDFFINQSNKELLPLEDYMREAENYYIQTVLNMHEGNITKAAGALGMSRQNLQYRLRKLKK